MKFFTFTKAGINWNEDRCYVCEKFGFVLDGATSLFEQKFSKFSTDAEWYSNWWKEYLIKNLPNTKKSIKEIVRKGIVDVTSAYIKLSKGEVVKDFPSSTISVFRVVEENIEYFCLGDSPILIETKSNYAFSVCKTDLILVDEINKCIIEDHANKENIDYIFAREQFSEFINEARKRKNSQNGYYILADFPDAVNYALIGIVPKNLIKKIIILSDGYSQIYEVFHYVHSKKLITKINSEKDVQKFYNKLFKLQEKDKKCNKFLRFKVRDDSTLVYYEF